MCLYFVTVFCFFHNQCFLSYKNAVFLVLSYDVVFIRSWTEFGGGRSKCT